MNCDNCSKPTPNPRFCSRSCAASVTNQEAPKRRKQPRLARRRIQDIREAARSRTLAEVRAKIKGQHPSWVMSYVRRWARQNLKDLLQVPCQACGYSKHVELCHIRPVSSFPASASLGEINDRRNIRVLCPNCHWEFDNL